MGTFDQTDRPFVTIDPDVMLAKPTISGTRLTVELILEELADGATVEDLLEDYPRLTRAGVRAALEYAVDMLCDDSVGGAGAGHV